MTRKELYKQTLEYLSNEYRFAETELDYETPFELLVAVILSAQCTDKRVNLTTPALFERYPDAHAMAKAEPEDIFPIIRSISYPNNKAKHLVGMANILLNEFNGIVPEKIEDLQKMPGVGRKTANVIASVIYNAPAMAVDTHVFRVSNRLGLTTAAKTPLAVEKQLVKYLPQDKIHIAHHWLILHGRYVCLARSPKCEICQISHICKYYASQNTSAALLKKEAADMKLKKKKVAIAKKNKIAKELKKRAVK